MTRRSFLTISCTLAGSVLLIVGLLPAQSEEEAGPLLAYVGTFSSPLRDVLPTQVDLPPGNGRGIHLFQVNRATGAMTPAGIHEMGTSPSCLALNASGTRLYSANETDRAGEDKEGTVSAFAINRVDGKLKLLNTRSFRRGRSHLCERPSVRTVPARGQLFWRLRGGAADSCRRSPGCRHRCQEPMPAKLAPPRRPTLHRAALPSADMIGRTRT